MQKVTAAQSLFRELPPGVDAHAPVIEVEVAVRRVGEFDLLNSALRDALAAHAEGAVLGRTPALVSNYLRAAELARFVDAEHQRAEDELAAARARYVEDANEVAAPMPLSPEMVFALVAGVELPGVAA